MLVKLGPRDLDLFRLPFRPKVQSAIMADCISYVRNEKVREYRLVADYMGNWDTRIRLACFKETYQVPKSVYSSILPLSCHQKAISSSQTALKPELRIVS